VHSTGTRRGWSDGTCPVACQTGDLALIAAQGSALRDPGAGADLGDIPAQQEVAIPAGNLLDS
jgi:hypothetical protein